MNYQQLVEGIGLKILVWTDERDYQGDSWALLESDQYSPAVGFLTFGWGSCSGCDALEHAQSEYEPEKSRRTVDLLSDLVDSIHWESSKSEMLAWINAKDWETEFHGDRAEFKEFLEQAKVALT